MIVHYLFLNLLICKINELKNKIILLKVEIFVFNFTINCCQLIELPPICFNYFVLNVMLLYLISYIRSVTGPLIYKFIYWFCIPSQHYYISCKYIDTIIYLSTKYSFVELITGSSVLVNNY